MALQDETIRFLPYSPYTRRRKSKRIPVNLTRNLTTSGLSTQASADRHSLIPRDAFYGGRTKKAVKKLTTQMQQVAVGMEEHEEEEK